MVRNPPVPSMLHRLLERLPKAGGQSTYDRVAQTQTHRDGVSFSPKKHQREN